MRESREFCDDVFAVYLFVSRQNEVFSLLSDNTDKITFVYNLYELSIVLICIKQVYSANYKIYTITSYV